MRMNKIPSWINLLLLASSIALTEATVIQCDQTTKIQPTDFLFLIDASRSMCPYSEALAGGVQNFINNLNKELPNGNPNNYFRFAVATFGGIPRIVQPFSVSRKNLRTSHFLFK